MKAKKQHKPSDVLECEICCAACKHQMMTGTIQVLYLQVPYDARPGVRPPLLHRLLDGVPHHQDNGRGQITRCHSPTYNISIPRLQLNSALGSQSDDRVSRQLQYCGQRSDGEGGRLGVETGGSPELGRLAMIVTVEIVDDCECGDCQWL